MTKATALFLVDTNIWLDMLLGRPNGKVSSALIVRANARDDFMAVTASQLKDIFYVVGQELKRRARLEEGAMSTAHASSINEIAWSCLSYVQKQAMVIDEGLSEYCEASTLRAQCSDYEDAILMACARRAKMDFIVTNDKQLLAQSAVRAITPAEYLEAYAV